MLRFLHSLCDFLPASSHIQPLRGASEAWAQDVGRALEREVLALRDGLPCLLGSGGADGKRSCQGRGGGSGPGGGGALLAAAPTEEVDELQRRREEWHRDIEGSKRKVGPLVAMDRYGSLIKNLLQVQQQVDIDVLLGTETGSVSAH